MGKGDRKTAKGKRSIASYGNMRSHAAAKTTGATKAPVVKKATAKTATKAAPKTTASKTASKTVSKAPAKKVAKKAAAKE